MPTGKGKSGVPATAASPSIPSAVAERGFLPAEGAKGSWRLGGAAASSSFGGGWLGIQVKGRLSAVLRTWSTGPHPGRGNCVVAGLEEEKRRGEKVKKSKVHPELCEGS